MQDWNDFWSRFSEEGYDYVGILPENKRMLERISNLVGTNRKVLDAGCGSGNLTVRLASNSNHVTAIDFSEAMVKAVQEKVSSLKNVAVQKGNVTQLGFRDGFFDVVVSVNVLFNLDEPEKAVKEMKRVLRSNGRLIISTPSKDAGLSSDFLRRVIVDAREGNVEPEKLKLLERFNRVLFEKGGMKFTPSEDELKILLAKNGLEILTFDKVYYGNNFLVEAINI